MEPRIAKLEALAEATKERMDRLDRDIRLVGYGLILLLAAGFGAFLYLSDKIDAETSMLASKIDASTGALSNKIDALTVAILEKLIQ